MKRVLIAGREGQVGWELKNMLSPSWEVVACNRQSFDLSDASMMRNVIREVRPHILINAAAYTAVDKAESDEDAAYKINAVAAGIMAEEAKAIGALFIHYSTDYIFDGTAAYPYHEDDANSPQNAYGRSKVAGEAAVIATSGKHLIFRTSWVYGSRGKNFLLTMLRLGAERDSLRIVADQIGAPTWSRSIARGTMQSMTAFEKGRGNGSGVYHMTCQGMTSWYGFADEIFCQAEIMHSMNNLRYPLPRLEAISTSEYPLPARRPQYSVLSNSKLKESFGVTLPEWKEALHDCMKEINWSSLPQRQNV